MQNEVNLLLPNNNINNQEVPGVIRPQANHQENENEEKKPLQDLDISHMIFIKNPNNEMAIGK
jgi:hypothetical protein